MRHFDSDQHDALCVGNLYTSFGQREPMRIAAASVSGIAWNGLRAVRPYAAVSSQLRIPSLTGRYGAVRNANLAHNYRTYRCSRLLRQKGAAQRPTIHPATAPNITPVMRIGA